MYLFYVDESGTSTNVSEKYFILAGVAVYENQAYYLGKALDELQSKYFPEFPDAIEFHANEIMNRRGPWQGFASRDERQAILGEICDAITSINPQGLALFGVAVHKTSFPQDDPVEKAFYDLCGHFDAFLDRGNRVEGRTKNRGLMILDSQRYSGRLDRRLQEYRLRGGRIGRVRNFADAPTFADSRATRLLQAADIVAYAVYRRYERSDAYLMDRLIGRFDNVDGKFHGLMHLVSRWRECACPACMSRVLSERLGVFSPSNRTRVDSTDSDPILDEPVSDSQSSVPPLT